MSGSHATRKTALDTKNVSMRQHSARSTALLKGCISFQRRPLKRNTFLNIQLDNCQRGCRYDVREHDNDKRTTSRESVKRNRDDSRISNRGEISERNCASISTSQHLSISALGNDIFNCQERHQAGSRRTMGIGQLHLENNVSG